MNEISTKIIKQVKDAIDGHELIPEGSTVVLGLSGGPDSLCLFDVLGKLSEEMDFSLRAVHVNHQLRGEDADRDQEFVEALCVDSGVTLDVTVFDCAAMAKELGITTEEAGRIKRYEAFDDAADRADVDAVIAVAHNYDDQAETIMFRLMRGTGPDGLAGMEYKRMDERGHDLIRPLLDCRKEDILKYCEENGLEPRIDRTNGEAVYSRNSIRLEVFPFLEKYSPNIMDALVRLGNIAREDKAFLGDLADEVFSYALKSAVKDSMITLDGEKLRKIAGPVRRRVIALAASKIGLTEDLTTQHYESIDSVIYGGSPSAGVDLPHGYRFTNVYKDVRIQAPDESGKVIPPGRIEVVSKDDFDEMEIRKGSYAAFDLDALELRFGGDAGEKATWRRREAGDYIEIKGAPKEERDPAVRLTLSPVTKDGVYKKKIQDIFVDDKVPKADRDSVYYAAVGSEVLFIPKQEGVARGRWAAGYEVTQGTKRVLLVTID